MSKCLVGEEPRHETGEFGGGGEIRGTCGVKPRVMTTGEKAHDGFMVMVMV